MVKDKPYIDKNGYIRGKPEHSDLISRQMAYYEIYLKNRDKYPLPFIKYDVHHIDFHKLNNDPSNLQIVTRQEHIAIHKGLSGQKEISEYETEQKIEENRKKSLEGNKRKKKEKEKRRKEHERKQKRTKERRRKKKLKKKEVPKKIKPVKTIVVYKSKKPIYRPDYKKIIFVVAMLIILIILAVFIFKKTLIVPNLIYKFTLNNLDNPDDLLYINEGLFSKLGESCKITCDNYNQNYSGHEYWSGNYFFECYCINSEDQRNKYKKFII